MNTYTKLHELHNRIVELAAEMKVAMASQYIFVCDLETGEVVTMSLQTRGIHDAKSRD